MATDLWMVSLFITGCLCFLAANVMWLGRLLGWWS